MREKHILFSQRYLEKLLSGEKRATIRLRCPGLRPGDKALVHCGGRIIGEIEVLAVYRKRLRDITIDEALLDGFVSLHELRLHLKKHYPGGEGKCTPLYSHIQVDKCVPRSHK
jgi:hypothetical protein